MTESRLPSARAMIGGWTIERYQRLLSPQLIVSPALFLVTLFRASNAILIIAEVVWFGVIGYLIGSRRGGRLEAIVAGGVGGFLTGIAVALGRWLASPTASWGVNVISETLVTALIGTLIATATFILVRRLRYPPQKSF